MKTFVLNGLIFFTALTSSAQSPYSIDLMGTSKQYLHHNNVWKEGTDCVNVKVTSEVPLKKSDIVIKAYFYSAEGKVQHVAERPSPSFTKYTMETVPDVLEKGKKHEFFFAIPERYSKGSSKWKRAVVVFGDQSKVAARIYPKDDITKFEFAEKSRMKQ